MSFRVMEKKKNVFEMDVRLKSFQVLMLSGNGGGFAATSKKLSEAEKDQDNPLSQLLRKVVDKPFQVKMTEDGEVLEVNNHEKIWKDALSGLASAKTSIKRDMMPFLEKLSSDEIFKSELQQIFSFYSGEVIRESSNWSNLIW